MTLGRNTRLGRKQRHRRRRRILNRIQQRALNRWAAPLMPSRAVRAQMAPATSLATESHPDPESESDRTETGSEYRSDSDRTETDDEAQQAFRRMHAQDDSDDEFIQIHGRFRRDIDTTYTDIPTWSVLVEDAYSMIATQEEAETVIVHGGAYAEELERQEAAVKAPEESVKAFENRKITQAMDAFLHAIPPDNLASTIRWMARHYLCLRDGVEATATGTTEDDERIPTSFHITFAASCAAAEQRLLAR